jgi:hypothetical protein
MLTNESRQALTVPCLKTSALPLCYSDAELQALIDRVPAEGVVPVLLSLPPADARRVLAGLLPSESRIVWATACAARAKAYATATASTYAATYASYAAYDAAAYDAEHETAVRHAVALLGWEK